MLEKGSLMLAFCDGFPTAYCTDDISCTLLDGDKLASIRSYFTSLSLSFCFEVECCLVMKNKLCKLTHPIDFL